jgi:hypothetical protein
MSETPTPLPPPPEKPNRTGLYLLLGGLGCVGIIVFVLVVVAVLYFIGKNAKPTPAPLPPPAPVAGPASSGAARPQMQAGEDLNKFALRRLLAMMTEIWEGRNANAAPFLALVGGQVEDYRSPGSKQRVDQVCAELARMIPKEGVLKKQSSTFKPDGSTAEFSYTLSVQRGPVTGTKTFDFKLIDGEHRITFAGYRADP